MGHPG